MLHDSVLFRLRTELAVVALKALVSVTWLGIKEMVAQAGRFTTSQLILRKAAVVWRYLKPLPSKSRLCY